jgi:hypothetical protein
VNGLGRSPAFGGGEVGLPTHFIDIQIPVIQQRFSDSPLKTVAIIGFEFEFSVSADAVNMATGARHE